MQDLFSTRDAYRGPLLFLRFGSRGNELAWKYRRWESLEAFQRIQKRWATAALVLFLAFAIPVLVVFPLAVAFVLRRLASLL
ncbi:MAG: hypothetical protein AUI36_45560 [Cyanobacteria bacterium 13_1_40CM_2_61_4]|nr:MAG: hypothetical protein AUI36_45560 [Cyanobacteria bacterium 13_1_40CM_2_61_4]